MTKTAYFDCFSGVSGDMVLGALLDAGVQIKDLRRELGRLPLEGWTLEAAAVKRAGLRAIHVEVRVQGRPHPRTFPQVQAIIEASGLPRAQQAQGVAVFRRLAEAEGRVHGQPADEVHLHDVGAVDAIIDVMGAVIGLNLLDVQRVYASPFPAGQGEVLVEGVSLPVPTPATLDLLASARAPVVESSGGELVTPTGAAIVTTLAAFRRPDLTLERVGYGAGSRDLAERPNVLRLWLGEPVEGSGRGMLLIETNIDDMPGEMLAHAQEKLLAAGAADAWFTSIQMKKGRPAVMLSVLCNEALEERLSRLILRETSTLGVRARTVHRYVAEREVMEFQSTLGRAAVKIKRLPGERPSVAPEYEACRQLAESSGLTLAEVYRIVEAEAEARLAEQAG